MMIPLEADRYYHIYNHANGFDNLFTEKRNYYFFMDKYKEHVYPIAETLAYCLMPNHFHILVRIRHVLPQEVRIYKAFANLFSSYTLSYNKVYNRSGSLFQKNFKRKLVDSEDYLKRLIMYIHCNPVIDGFAKHPWQWPFSSYNAILLQKDTLVDFKTVIEVFDDIRNFEYMHQQPGNFSFDY